MVIPYFFNVISDYLRGRAQKIKDGLSWRKKMVVLEKGAAIEAKIVLVLSRNSFDMFDIALIGKRSACKDGIEIGNIRITFHKAGHSFFNDVIDPGTGEEVPKSGDGGLHHDGIADMHVRYDQYTIKFLDLLQNFQILLVK